MSDLGLFDSHPVFAVGDALGRCYTTDSLADRCLGALVREGFDPHLDGGIAVEPSVGAAAFVRVGRRRWPTLRWYGVDRDPLAIGLQPEVCHSSTLGDWPTIAVDFEQLHGRPTLVVGNPPFDDPLGGDPDRARRHLQAALDLRPDWIGFILPIEYSCTVAWQPFVDAAWAIYRIPGRHWSKVRGCGFYVWRPRLPPPEFTRFRRLQ